VVDVIDNFTTGKTENVKHLLGLRIDETDPQLVVRHGDIRAVDADPARDDGRSMSQYDVIYNLACPASPVAYQQDGLSTVMTNVVGTTNLLALAMAHKARFVQASTSEVYGDPVEHPQSEAYWGNVNPFGPRSCYDEGKRCAETICWEFRKNGVDVRIARIFNTYGSGADPMDQRVVIKMVVAALQNRDIVVNGSGEQLRTFCWVEDLVEGLVRLMETPPSAGAVRTVNLGSNHEISIRALAEKIVALTGSRSRIVHTAARADDARRRAPDISAARRELGWVPRTPLAEGLRRTISYAEKELADKAYAGVTWAEMN
jgi:UDP-glucuronate decarboxylase